MTQTIADLSGEYGRELEVAAAVAKAAGQVVMQYHGTDLEVDLKDGDEPVTAADRESSALITARLRECFPDDIVISEESPDDQRRLTAPRVWYVDPVDGTKDFIRGETGFCVMIGLVLDGRPGLGVVHQPIEMITYLAAPQAGAFLQSRDETPERLSTSTRETLSELRMVVSKSHRDAIIDRIKGALGCEHERNIGSIGLKLGLLATGSEDLYVTTSDKCSSWDTVAPAAILLEAGGVLTDIDGELLRYDRLSLSHNRGLLASNGVVHPKVVAALAPLFS